MKRQNIIRTLSLLLFIFLFFNGTVLQVSASTDVREVLLQEVNAQRVSRGLQPLTLDDTLNADAQIRAREITSCFSHTRPNGTPWYTVDHSRVFGETLALGYNCSAEGARGIIGLWMHSPAHASLLLNGHFHNIGFAACPGSDGNWYWTAELGY